MPPSATPQARLLEPDPNKLLSWYDRVKRSLPWRGHRDPYAILVSEVMLQQTRVEVVRDRYQSFLERFPSLEAIANASEDQVLAAWSGLGYYRRARSLRAAAKEVYAAGEWPRTAKDLEKLPGLGPYTAAAVASIAFGEAVPTLDGNVKRVMSRLLASSELVAKKQTQKTLAREAARWLDGSRPGDSNQALMELGATVCTPRPRCEACPLAQHCRAAAFGEPERYPQASTSKPTLARHWWLVVIERRGRIWLTQRKAEEAWLPGIFELPWIEFKDKVDAPNLSQDATLASQKMIELKDKYGVEIRLVEEVGSVNHAIGRRRIRALVWRGELVWHGELAEKDSELGRWVARDRLDSVATTSLVDKSLKLVAAERANQS